MPYTESSYENAIIQLFEEMGYTHAYGPDVVRDYLCGRANSGIIPAESVAA